MKTANNLLQNTSSLIDQAGTSSSMMSMVPAPQGSPNLTNINQINNNLINSNSSTNQLNISTFQQLVPNGMNGTNGIMNNNNNGQSMLSMLSPSRPLNISELSNSSMVSSSSASSTIDSSSANSTNKRSRVSKNSSDPNQKDGKYFERRKRNNVAAKKSRDARKQREDEIAIRASFLEKENSILKAQLQTLKDEAQQLRILLSQKKSNTMNGGGGGGGCLNCSSMGCSSKQQHQQQQPQQQQLGSQNPAANLGLMNAGYAVNQGLNGLIAQTHFDHHPDPNQSLLNLDKHQNQNTITSNVVLPSASSLANASIYLQHQNQHRHQII